MSKQTIAFEIGTEELPAFELHDATQQIDKIINCQPGKLFSYDSAKVYSTPRRLIIVVEGVPEKIEAKVEEFRGPAERIAYADGEPTKAAIGFARGKGADVADLELKEVDGEKYVFVTKKTPEKKISDILPGLL